MVARDPADDHPTPRRTEARRAEVATALARAEGGDGEAARELFCEVDDWADFRDPLRARLELGQLRYVLAHPADFADDTARELYSALLERSAGDRARLAEVRAIGATLHELERAGARPRVMVVRTRRRRE